MILAPKCGLGYCAKVLRYTGFLLAASSLLKSMTPIGACWRIVSKYPRPDGLKRSRWIKSSVSNDLVFMVIAEWDSIRAIGSRMASETRNSRARMII